MDVAVSFRNAPIDPVERGVERRIAIGQEIGAGERHRLVRDHPTALQTSTVGRHEIAVGVDQDVAVRQLVEERRQCLTHRRLTEHTRASQRLHSPGEAFGRTATQGIHQNRHRPAEHVDARARPRSRVEGSPRSAPRCHASS